MADPKVVGPGKWDDIHSKAKRAVTPTLLRGFVQYMLEMCEDFRCNRCSGHCLKYLKDHPIDHHVNDPMYAFYWSVDFHNTLNRFLKKKEFSREEAVTLYYGSAVCSQECAPLKQIKIVYIKN
jgi:hypothetical protein